MRQKNIKCDALFKLFSRDATKISYVMSRCDVCDTICSHLLSQCLSLLVRIYNHLKRILYFVYSSVTTFEFPHYSGQNRLA